MEVLEEWRDVVGFEGLYEVSNLGRVRSYYGKNGVRYLKCKKSKHGYIEFGLYKNGKQKFWKVHRLVYTAFNGPIPEGMQIDHIDGDKTNNNLRNLRCVTPRENSSNPITMVRCLEAIKKRTLSEQWRQKTIEALAKAVLQLDKDTGDVIREWQSARDAWRALGISHGDISSCCHGKLKSAGGYRWCFALAKDS